MSYFHQQGATGSIDTGPTLAARGSYYKYIETSATMLGEKAILESVRTFQGTVT